MSDMHYLGEITMFGGNFAPRGWTFCEGQEIAISQNQALFALLGTRYGGDGRTTFRLPNLKRRFPTHPFMQGGYAQSGGANQIILHESQLPAHAHYLFASADESDTEAPANTTLADISARLGANVYRTEATNLVQMSAASISKTGASTPIDITPPFTEINFIICLNGIFPSRN